MRRQRVHRRPGPAPRPTPPHPAPPHPAPPPPAPHPAATTWAPHRTVRPTPTTRRAWMAQVRTPTTAHPQATAWPTPTLTALVASAQIATEARTRAAGPRSRGLFLF